MNWLETLPDNWWNQYETNSLSSECIQELNIELLFLIRSLLLETRTYARVCKRSRILINDFQNALDARNIHRSVKSEKTIISLSLLIDQTDQIPSDIDELNLSIHWLAIDGEQPIIPENPLPNFSQETSFHQNQQKIIPSQLIDQSPLLKKLFEMSSLTKSKNHQVQDHIHPLTKNNLTIKPIHPRNVPIRRSHIPNNILSEQTCLAHELSLEQQLYFKSLTESCFNENDQQYTEVFHRLSSDASLQPLLPRLLLFINQGIQTNIHLHDLNFIIQFLSILKMLTLNTFISFDKYLHIVIPSILTCLLCTFDMSKTDNDLSIIDQNNSKVWILREQASDLLLYFQNKYSNISYLTQRIVTVIKSSLIAHDRNIITYSIAYACIRTLLMIDIQIFGLFVTNIFETYKKKKIFESDFDLDDIEQMTIFNQKINDLFQKYKLIV